MGILLIDPNETERKMIADHLHNWGYHNIHSFKDVQEAETKLSLNSDGVINAIFSIDTAIIDVSGGQEYYRLIEKMKHSYILKNVPIIAMSEHSRAEAMSSSFAYGASDFLSKPIQEFELKARVRSGIKLKFEIERRMARERELLEATNQLADLNELLSNMSLMDSLTGIPNRRCFDNTVEQEWRRAERNGSALTFIMIDIDFFKQYNDTYGHQMGDSCLVEVARAIKTQLRRPGDFLARYGGEEFAIVLPNTSSDQIEVLCKQINQHLASIHIPHETSKVAKHITVSMGISSAAPSADKSATPADLINDADKLLYQAKDNGRNQYVISTSSESKKPA